MDGILPQVEDWTEAGVWPTLAEANEHALVVLAMRMDCRVLWTGAGYAVEVEPEQVARARAELREYEAERAEDGAMAAHMESTGDAGFWLTLAWAALLVGIHVWRDGRPGVLARWANEAGMVCGEGEYWRTFTALFLHADAAHVLGNILIGGVFCLAVTVVFGAWRGWGLILLGGAAGNWLGDWIHWLDGDKGFRSIGSSTATFAALGLLVGGGLVASFRSGNYRQLMVLSAPMAAGLALLGMFGSGGEDGPGNIDVLGHVAGWAVGVVLGIAMASLHTRRGSGPH